MKQTIAWRSFASFAVSKGPDSEGIKRARHRRPFGSRSRAKEDAMSDKPENPEQPSTSLAEAAERLAAKLRELGFKEVPPPDASGENPPSGTGKYKVTFIQKKRKDTND
ncbi:MAG: hypothetical protein D6771_03040 [Zetaproteobacteria bacterium]|nr:MAG: hypothetical protein D6771_03040 [Zetaproteobacteria bacterium]